MSSHRVCRSTKSVQHNRKKILETKRDKKDYDEITEKKDERRGKQGTNPKSLQFLAMPQK